MTTATKTAKKQTTQPTVKKNNYKELVIGTNKNLKTFTKSTGGALKMLLLLDDLNPRLKKVIKAAQKDDSIYKSLDKSVRRNKKGLTCPFYVLQAIYKGLDK